MTSLTVQKGYANLYYAFEVGFTINLTDVEERITLAKERFSVQSRKKVRKYFQFNPAPLRIVVPTTSITINSKYSTEATAEALIFDFGAISISLRVKIGGTFPDLVQLNVDLYENEVLKAHARSVVDRLLVEIKPAIQKLKVSESIEEYVAFQFDEIQPKLTSDEFIEKYPSEIAGLLRAETAPLSKEAIKDAVSQRICYGQDEVVFVDWISSLIIDKSPQDICALFEYANVALLEYSLLDKDLDRAVDQFYDFFSTKKTRLFRFRLKSLGPELRSIGQFQLDSAFLFEGVSNALKLFGDEYLARIYRLATVTLGVTEWDDAISRKLKMVESIYAKVSDVESSRRMEVLEIVIIILIAVSMFI